MIKKIAIFGSTGSVGKSTIDIIRKDKKKFKIILLSTNSNVENILKQAKEFKVKNIIINDFKKFIQAKTKYKKLKINFFNNFKHIKKKFNIKEIDYTMISVSGLSGIELSLDLCKFSKTLAIVNKESLICGWNLILKNLIKYKTNFIPIDSEHYSIFALLKNHEINEIKKIYITASGGPFLNLPKKKFKKIKPKTALKHPNWKMGKKITIDSATLMNKVFEVIEARHIFNIPYDKISILTHPSSYIHAIISFKNGVIKILAHEPNMKIPIQNSLYTNDKNNFKSKPLNLKIMNKLNFKQVNNKKFLSVKLLKKLPNYNSLYETVLLTINDYFVYQFLNNKISFEQLIKSIYKFSNSREFLKYKKIKVNNIKQIYKLKKYVSIKMENLSV